jgi:hypothetical protein
VKADMQKMNKAPILNSIQVAAEVNAAFRNLPGENLVVVVTKSDGEYNVYAGKGGVEDGHLVES